MTVDEVMAERGQLISKKFGEGITADEADRLAFLNEEAGRLCPRVTKEMLRALEDSVAAHEKLAREIAELLSEV